MSTPELISQAVEAKEHRAVYEYDLPPTIAKESGISKIGVVVLTGEEYELAIERTRGTPIRLATELPKMCLWTVNGRRVTTADASTDQAWNKLGPKGRDLLTSAYGRLHSPTQDEATAFLQSQRVSAG